MADDLIPFTEKQWAERDARLYGAGFLLDGKRVDPARVHMVKPPELEAELARRLGRATT